MKNEILESEYQLLPIEQQSVYKEVWQYDHPIYWGVDADDQAYEKYKTFEEYSKSIHADTRKIYRLKPVKYALELIADERRRQIDKYGYTDEHIQNLPNDYADGELAMAAAAYCCSNRWVTKDYGYLPDILFPWSDEYFKPSPDDRVKELTKAGAMIVAEINRINKKVNAGN